MALELFKLVGSIFVDNEQANESLAKTDKKASNVAETLGKGVKTIGKWGSAMAVGASAVVTGITSIATSSADACDEIDKMSAKIGLSKEGYQEWSYVMAQNGMDVDKLQTGMKTLRQQMELAEKGTGASAEAFKQLGVSLTDANGNAKDQETVMNETIRALANVEDGTEKSSLAFKLFGKAGLEMMPMLNQGAGEIDNLTQRAHDLGLVLSDETVDAGVLLGDTMDDVKNSFSTMATKLGASVMPVVQKFADFLLANMPTFQAMFEALTPIISAIFEQLLPPVMQLVEQLLPVLVELFNVIMPILSQILAEVLPVFIELLMTLIPPIMEIVRTLLPPLLEVIKALMPIFQVVINLLKPILDLVTKLIQPIAEIISECIAPLITTVVELITVALEPIMPIIQALATLLSKTLGKAFEALKPVIDAITSVFRGLIDFITGGFTDGWSSAFEGIKDIVATIFEAMVNIIKAPLNFIIEGINFFIRGLNKIKIPDWVPGVGGYGINIPEIPKLAKGGIVDEGQMFIANEKGPEMVGSYGSKSAVVNNGQIVDSIVNGVARGVSGALGSALSVADISNAISNALKDVAIRAFVTEDDVFEATKKKNKEYYEQTRQSAFVY
jgi:phage-related minor tail protein